MDQSAVETLHDDVQLTPVRRTYNKVHCLVLYSFTFVVFGLAASIVGPTASALAKRNHIEETALGPLFFISGLVCLVGSIPGGWFADKSTAHTVLGLCLLSEAFAFVLTPECTSLTCLIVVNSSASFTYNFLNTIVNTLTVWVDQANFRTWLNFVNTLFGVGSMLTPLLATAAHAFLGSFLAAYWVVAACAAVCAVFCFLVAAPPPPASYSDPPREAKRPGSAGPRPSSAASYWCMLLSVVGLLGLAVGSEVSFGAWIFTYSHKFASLDVDTSEAINSTYWAAFTAARVVATLAAKWVHPAVVLLLSIPLALLGTLLPLLLPPGAIQAPALFLCSALVGTGASTGYANIVSLFGHYAPMQGSVMGLFSAASSIGCMVMPMLMASLARHTSAGYQSVMWVLCAAYCVQLLLLGVVVLTGQHYLHRLVALAEEEPLLVDAFEDGAGSGSGGGGGGGVA